jgi:hypothetical protein
MINPGIAESLALDHQRELRRAADTARLARRVRSVADRPVRARAGWWLVHAGIRIALSADAGGSLASPTSSPLAPRSAALASPPLSSSLSSSLRAPAGPAPGQRMPGTTSTAWPKGAMPA